MRAAALILASAVALAACSSGGSDGSGGEGAEEATTSASTSAPSPTTTTAPQVDRLVLHVTGEVSFDPATLPGAAEQPASALAAVVGLFATDDLSIVPLTCSVGVDELAAAQPCGPSALAAMAQAGVDVVALATAGQSGAAAAGTADAVAAAGMQAVGAGADATAAVRPAVVEVGGRTIAVLAASVIAGEDAYATAGAPGIADGRDPFVLGAAVAGAAEEADAVVVLLHWGEDQAQAPRAQDVDLARALVGAGADAVVGHGAHRLHRLEAFGDAVLFLGTGDFVATGDPPPSADTAVARVVWRAGAPTLGCLLAATIAAPGAPVLDDPATTTCAGE